MHLYLKNSSDRQQNVLQIIAPRMFVSIIRHANRTFGIYGLSGSVVFVVSHKQCGLGGENLISENSSPPSTLQRHKNTHVSLPSVSRILLSQLHHTGLCLTGLYKVTDIKCHDNPSSAQRG
jgi:hypothetical protein